MGTVSMVMVGFMLVLSDIYMILESMSRICIMNYYVYLRDGGLIIP